MNQVIAINRSAGARFSTFTPAIKSYWADQLIDSIGYTRDLKQPYLK